MLHHSPRKLSADTKGFTNLLELSGLGFVVLGDTIGNDAK